MFSKAIFKYAVLAAIRDRILWTISALMALSAVFAIFSASMAVTEQSQFTLVFFGSSIRLIVVLGLIAFISFQMRRLYDVKEIDYFFATPITRTGFLLNLFAAFTSITVLFGGGFLFLVAALMQKFNDGFLLWAVSVLSEWIIVIAMSLFFSSLIKSATASLLSTLSFYILSRMIGVFLILATSPFNQENQTASFFSKILEFISIFVPRFDLMGQSSWLIYQDDFNIGFLFIAVQVFVFVGLFLSAAVFDIQRNEF